MKMNSASAIYRIDNFYMNMIIESDAHDHWSQTQLHAVEETDNKEERKNREKRLYLSMIKVHFSNLCVPTVP